MGQLVQAWPSGGQRSARQLLRSKAETEVLKGLAMSRGIGYKSDRALGAVGTGQPQFP